MKRFPWILILIGTAAIPFSVAAEETSENIVKGKGTFTCNGGGGQKPLFNSECKQLSINRVTTPGGIKYEATCTDSGNTTFQLACDAFAFEQKQVVF